MTSRPVRRKIKFVWTASRSKQHKLAAVGTSMIIYIDVCVMMVGVWFTRVCVTHGLIQYSWVWHAYATYTPHLVLALRKDPRGRCPVYMHHARAVPETMRAVV